MRLVGLDFESEGIRPRPDYPPRPVGLAVWHDCDGRYLAWGHPEGNNCDLDHAVGLLRRTLSDEGTEVVFHNAAFDCAIIEELLGIPVPWGRVHDTMLMAFLADPYGELSLKPLAHRLLGEPPEEQDAVRAWLVRHGRCAANSKDWGAHICEAPVSVVAPYAVGDAKRTVALYEHLRPVLLRRGML